MATVSVNTAQPNRGVFTFPMEFTPSRRRGGWQLSKRTADMLLALSNSQTPATAAGCTPGSATRPAGSPQPATGTTGPTSTAGTIVAG